MIGTRGSQMAHDALPDWLQCDISRRSDNRMPTMATPLNSLFHDVRLDDES